MRDKGEETFYAILICLVLGFICFCFESCWSDSVAENDIYAHKYIIVNGGYYATEDIEYISSDVVRHDKNIITIHFKNGITYQTQEGQYVFAETKPNEEGNINESN